MRIAAAPRILIVAAACAAALIGLVVSEGAARSSGQEVLLPIEAVDPRSLLSGHFVRINLTQRLAEGEVCPQSEGDRWVALRPQGRTHRVAGAAGSRERAQLLGPLPVLGSFTCAEGAPGWLQLNIGIDRFHINQTDAEHIERVLREQSPGKETSAFAIVSIGRDGVARLKGLEIEGERLELSWL